MKMIDHRTWHIQAAITVIVYMRNNVGKFWRQGRESPLVLLTFAVKCALMRVDG